MNNLKEAIAKLKDIEATAEIDPTTCDPRVRAGVEANVRNAKAQLDKAQREYQDALMGSVVIIGVSGKTGEDFAKGAEKAGAIAVDFNMIIDRLANNLSKRATGPEYTSDSHFKLIDELAKIRLEYDMVQLPNPQINAYNDGIYNSPLKEAITKLLAKNYGTGLQSAVTRREIGKKGLAVRFSGKKLPVVVYNLSEEVDVRFIPAPVTTITSNTKVTANVVKKRLSEIKNMLLEKQVEDPQTNGQSAQTEENI